MKSCYTNLLIQSRDSCLVYWNSHSPGFFVGEKHWPLSDLCSPNIEIVGHIDE